MTDLVSDIIARARGAGQSAAGAHAGPDSGEPASSAGAGTAAREPRRVWLAVWRGERQLSRMGRRSSNLGKMYLDRA